ncbi:MAG: hypothetical protein R3D55_09770 [Chloroflexota bacterium]
MVRPPHPTTATRKQIDGVVDGNGKVGNEIVVDITDAGHRDSGGAGVKHSGGEAVQALRGEKGQVASQEVDAAARHGRCCDHDVAQAVVGHIAHACQLGNGQAAQGFPSGLGENFNLARGLPVEFLLVDAVACAAQNEDDTAVLGSPIIMSSSPSPLTSPAG